MSATKKTAGMLSDGAHGGYVSNLKNCGHTQLFKNKLAAGMY
jgi:hypothetical protein